jgi:hypothetical protein
MEKVPLFDLLVPGLEFGQVLFVLLQLCEGKMGRGGLLLQFLKELLATMDDFRVLFVACPVEDGFEDSGWAKVLTQKHIGLATALLHDVLPQTPKFLLVRAGGWQHADRVLKENSTSGLDLTPDLDSVLGRLCGDAIDQKQPICFHWAFLTESNTVSIIRANRVPLPVS